MQMEQIITSAQYVLNTSFIRRVRVQMNGLLVGMGVMMATECKVSKRMAKVENIFSAKLSRT